MSDDHLLLQSKFWELWLDREGFGVWVCGDGSQQWRQGRVLQRFLQPQVADRFCFSGMCSFPMFLVCLSLLKSIAESIFRSPDGSVNQEASLLHPIKKPHTLLYSCLLSCANG